MNFIERIITSMGNVCKPQRHFMVALLTSFKLFMGRGTMRNFSRYGVGSVRRISRWKKRSFDFPYFNMLAIEEYSIISKNEVVLVFDPTFIENLHGNVVSTMKNL